MVIKLLKHSKLDGAQMAAQRHYFPTEEVLPSALSFQLLPSGQRRSSDKGESDKPCNMRLKAQVQLRISVLMKWCWRREGSYAGLMLALAFFRPPPGKLLLEDRPALSLGRFKAKSGRAV